MVDTNGAEILNRLVVDAVELGFQQAEHLVGIDTLTALVLKLLLAPLWSAQVSHPQGLRPAQ